MLPYDIFIEEFHNVLYVGIYEYPTSQLGTFDLLIHRSGQIQGISGRGGHRLVDQGGRGGRKFSQVRFKNNTNRVYK